MAAISPHGRPSFLPTPDIDVILTGDMRYPPNRDAAEWLADAIAPKLQARRQALRIVVAGRSAPLLAPRPGMEVQSDVPDLWALLRRPRVARPPAARDRHGDQGA